MGPHLPKSGMVIQQVYMYYFNKRNQSFFYSQTHIQPVSHGFGPAITMHDLGQWADSDSGVEYVQAGALAWAN